MNTSKKIMELPEYINDLLIDITNQENFKDFNIQTSAGSNHGDGYLAEIIRITITESSLPEKILKLIVKLMPATAIRREQFNSVNVFEREAYMYNTLLPAFKEFQKSKGLNILDSFLNYPKCYAAYADAKSDKYAIVLEDLKDAGFEMWNKTMPSTFEHVQLFMKSLGKFHAISFALRDQKPEVLKPFEALSDLFVLQMEEEKQEMIQGMFFSAIDRGLNTLDVDEKVEREVMTKVRDNYLSILKSCVNASNAAPFLVVNHGDCWNNNIMYQYKNSKTPENVSILDWQLSRYSSPTLDLVYFLFSSTEKELREKHYDELLKIYHNSLRKTLQLLGSDADKLFSWQNLQDELKKFGVYALIFAPVLLQFITSAPADIPDLDAYTEKIANNEISFEEAMKTFQNESTAHLYITRVRDVIRDCVRLGYYNV